MLNAAERADLVRKKAYRIRKQGRIRSVWTLAVLSLIQSVCLAGLLDSRTENAIVQVAGMYGAVLLHQNVGGYVLVGVISFLLASVITLLCVRWKEKNKE